MYLLQEHAGDDTTSLYLEERESQIQQAAEEKRNKMLAIPGIINPHDRPDDMQQEWPGCIRVHYSYCWHFLNMTHWHCTRMTVYN